MELRKVNLFIVGAMKAGTTSLIDLLSQHKEIYVSPVKEPHYFINSLPNNLYEPSRFFNLDSYLVNSFPKPLHIAKIETEQQYNKIFSLAEKQTYLAEASTAYLHSDESAKLIHSYNPEAKIIIIIRDPLERAFSHYKMNLGKGRERLIFEEALSKEISLYKQKKLPWNSYLGMSFYKKAIENYRRTFKNILVLQFEELIKNPSESLQKVTSFLGVEKFNNYETRHKNESKTLYFQRLFYYLKQLGLKDIFSMVFSDRFKQWLFGMVSKKVKQQIILTDEIASELKFIFKKESKL